MCLHNKLEQSLFYNLLSSGASDREAERLVISIQLTKVNANAAAAVAHAVVYRQA